MLTFGPKVTQTEFDENIFQGHDPICAIRCQEMILRDYGIQIPKDELTQFATEKGWYHGHGTKLGDVGNLLEVCNVGTHSMHCDSVYDLINELNEGHRVIVAVDSHEIWAKPGSLEYMFYRHLTNADHALIVTNIEVDVLDPKNSTVVLTDPGSGSILKYDMERFAHAWKDSNCFMMATDKPAPYQYNAETKTMEMSNFATDFTLQEFPFHNEFSDIWQIDDLGYVPYYVDGHLVNVTEDLTYDDFMNAFVTDSFGSLDDSFNMMDVGDTLTKVDFAETDVITDIMPMEDMFDYGDDGFDTFDDLSEV